MTTNPRIVVAGRTLRYNDVIAVDNIGFPFNPARSVSVATRSTRPRGDPIQYVVDWPAGQLIVRRLPTKMIEEGASVTNTFLPEHRILL